MEAAEEKELEDWLRHIGDDFVPGDPDQVTSPECDGQGEEGFCPEHSDCGKCRLEYMKKRGWLK